MNPPLKSLVYPHETIIFLAELPQFSTDLSMDPDVIWESHRPRMPKSWPAFGPSFRSRNMQRTFSRKKKLVRLVSDFVG